MSYNTLKGVMRSKWYVGEGQDNLDKRIEVFDGDGLILWVDSDDVHYSGLKLAKAIVKEHNDALKANGSRKEKARRG